jgi:hypothetical protein
MPYYVYAIQTDSKLNHLCGTFADYHDAEICERDLTPDVNSGHETFLTQQLG